MRTSERLNMTEHTDEKPELRILSELMKPTLNGDPLAVYQCLLLCQSHDIVLPDWLLSHLLSLISEYHLGKKPSWRGKGNRPVIVVRRRFETEVKRRAVLGVKHWVKNKDAYRGMPTRCINAWNEQEYFHQQMKTEADALGFASYGLRGVQMQDGGPTIKASVRTLRRVMSVKGQEPDLPLSSRIAEVFGLQNPDDIFGFDGELKPNLK